MSLRSLNPTLTLLHQSRVTPNILIKLKLQFQLYSTVSQHHNDFRNTYPLGSDLAGGYTSNTTQCLNNVDRAWQTTGACRNQNQILVGSWEVDSSTDWMPQTHDLKAKEYLWQTYNSTQFVQLCTNKFQGLFKDFLRTNYSFHGLKIYSINWHNPLLNTLLAKTHHRDICDVIPHASTSAIVDHIIIFILLSATTFSKWLDQVWLTCNYIWGTEIAFDRDRN